MDELQIHELTPPGAGGVSVVRLTGSGALKRLRELGVSPPPVGELRVARLVADGEALDEAPVPVRSDHEVELHLHGSPPPVRRLIRGDRQVPPASFEDEARRTLAHAPVQPAAPQPLARPTHPLRPAEARPLRVDGPPPGPGWAPGGAARVGAADGGGGGVCPSARGGVVGVPAYVSG